MATSYGTYSDYNLTFDPQNPNTLWDCFEYKCKRCSKIWIGGDTCFECLPSKLLFSKPKKEYLEYNSYKGPIPSELKKFWSCNEVKPKQYSFFSINEILFHLKKTSMTSYKLKNTKSKNLNLLISKVNHLNL